MDVAVDVILALAGAIIIIRHTCRGFVRTFFGFLRLAVGVAVAWYFTPMLFGEKQYVTRLMAYVLFFAGTFILISLLALLVDRIFKLPLLNAANKFFGFVCGCVCAYIVLGVFSDVITVFANMSGEELFAMSQKELADNTYIYGFFERNGIFSIIDRLYK